MNNENEQVFDTELFFCQHKGFSINKWNNRFVSYYTVGEILACIIESDLKLNFLFHHSAMKASLGKAESNESDWFKISNI